jgi:hypothetical protein
MSEDPEKKAPAPVEAFPENGSWKLPSGFENVIEDGALHVYCICVLDRTNSHRIYLTFETCRNC